MLISLIQILIIAAWIVVGFAFVVLLALIARGLVPRLLLVLGEQDYWWSPIRKLPPEGEMYIVLTGGSDGPFERVLESVPDYIFDPETHEFTKSVDVKSRPKKGYARWGVTWVGFNKGLLYRTVKYDKWEKSPNSQDYQLISKIRGGEGQPGIFFQYFMAAGILGAETKGNFPVNSTVSFTTQITNPVKAFFLAGGWETQVTAAVQGVVREHISVRDINTLRQEKAAGDHGNMITKIKDLDLSQFGLNIVDATFIDYDLETGDPEMSRATKASEIAKLESDARLVAALKDRETAVAKAEGEANALVTRAIGEERAATHRATAIGKEWKARVDAAGSQAGIIALAEAIKEGKVVAIGGEVLNSITPPRP